MTFTEKFKILIQFTNCHLRFRQQYKQIIISIRTKKKPDPLTDFTKDRLVASLHVYAEIDQLNQHLKYKI